MYVTYDIGYLPLNWVYVGWLQQVFKSAHPALISYGFRPMTSFGGSTIGPAPRYYPSTPPINDVVNMIIAKDFLLCYT